MMLVRRRWWSWTVASVVAVGAAAVALRPADGGSAGDERRAPRFVASAVTTDGAERSLDDYAGAPMLLNVWATWCDPCREEMPSLERLHHAYRDRGLQVVAVSIDDAGQEPLIREFVRDHELTFDILHDAKATIMRQYLVRGVPQTFLISRTGEIVGFRFAEDWDSPPNRALVDSLLFAEGPEVR